MPSPLFTATMHKWLLKPAEACVHVFYLGVQFYMHSKTLVL